MAGHTDYGEASRPPTGAATTPRSEAATIHALERRSQFLAVGLALVTLLMVVLAAAGVLSYAQGQKARRAEAPHRAADLDHEVTQAVTDAQFRLGDGKSLSDHPDQWKSALNAAADLLKRAESVQKMGEPKAEVKEKLQAVRAELEQAQRALDLLSKLDEIRLRDTDAPRAYALAVKDFGDDVRILEPALAAKKLTQLPNREAVLDRILDWADATTDAKERRHLLDVAKTADPDAESFLKLIAKKS